MAKTKDTNKSKKARGGAPDDVYAFRQFRASMLGKTKAEIYKYAFEEKRRGNMNAAEAGTSLHRLTQIQQYQSGAISSAEDFTYDPKANITGHIDAISPRYGIGDIKTVSRTKMAKIKRSGKPDPVHVSQLNLYLHTTGQKKGYIQYIMREDPSVQQYFEMRYDPELYDRDIAKLNEVRARIESEILTGKIDPSKLRKVEHVSVMEEEGSHNIEELQADIPRADEITDEFLKTQQKIDFAQLYSNRPKNPVKRRADYNTIKGLPHGWFGSSRDQTTAFGSSWRPYGPKYEEDFIRRFLVNQKAVDIETTGLDVDSKIIQIGIKSPGEKAREINILSNEPYAEFHKAPGGLAEQHKAWSIDPTKSSDWQEIRSSKTNRKYLARVAAIEEAKEMARNMISGGNKSANIIIHNVGFELKAFEALYGFKENPIRFSPEYQALIRKNRIGREADILDYRRGKLLASNVRANDIARQAAVYELTMQQASKGGAVIDTMEIAKTVNALAQEKGLVRATGDLTTGTSVDFLAKNLLGMTEAHTAVADIELQNMLAPKLSRLVEKLKDPSFNVSSLTKTEAGFITQLKQQQQSLKIAAQRKTIQRAVSTIKSGKEFTFAGGGKATKDIDTFLSHLSGVQDIPVSQGNRLLNYAISQEQIVEEAIKGMSNVEQADLLRLRGKAGLSTVPGRSPFLTKIAAKGRSLKSSLMTPQGMLAAGVVTAAGLIALGMSSGGDDHYNSIEGLRHGWFGNERNKYTDFGSGYKPGKKRGRDEINPTDRLLPAKIELVEQIVRQRGTVKDLAFSKLGMIGAGILATGVYAYSKISGKDDSYNTIEAFTHGWFGDKRRKNTDFGSGYKAPIYDEDPTPGIGYGGAILGAGALAAGYASLGIQTSLNIDDLSYLGELEGGGTWSKFLGREKATVGDILYSGVRRAEYALGGLPRSLSLSTALSSSFLANAELAIDLTTQKSGSYAKYLDQLLQRDLATEGIDQVIFKQGKLFGPTGEVLLEEARLYQSVFDPAILPQTGTKMPHSQLTKAYRGLAGTGSMPQAQFLVGGGKTKTAALLKAGDAYAAETLSKYLHLLDDPAKALRDAMPNISPTVTNFVERATKYLPKLGVGGYAKTVGKTTGQLLALHAQTALPWLIGVPLAYKTASWAVKETAQLFGFEDTAVGKAGITGALAEVGRVGHMTAARVSEMTGLTTIRNWSEDQAPGMVGLLPAAGIALSAGLTGAVAAAGTELFAEGRAAGTGAYKTLIDSLNVKAPLPGFLSKIPGFTGEYSKIGRWGRAGFLAGAAVATPLLLLGLGMKKSSEELEAEYEGKEVAIRKGRFWEFGCLPEGEVVLDKNFSPIPVQHILEGDILQTSDQASPVMKVMKRDYKGLVYEISSYHSDEVLRLTPNHPVLISDGSYIRADELEPSDYLVLPKKKIIPSIESVNVFHKGQSKIPLYSLDLNKESGWFLGYFFSTGFIAEKDEDKIGLKFLILKDKKEDIKKITAIAMSLFPTVEYSSTKHGDFHRNLLVRSPILALIAESLFCHDSKNGTQRKTLTHDFWSFPEDFISGFLSGIISANFQAGIGIQPIVLSCMAAVFQIRNLFMSFGILPDIQCHYSTKTSLTLKFGQTAIKKALQSLDIISKGEYLFLPDDSTFYQEDEDYFYVKINKIATFQYSGKVYDFSVPPSKNFLTSLGIVHNSTPYEGGRVDRYEPNWYNKILDDPSSAVLYKGEDIGPIEDLARSVVDPYWKEKLNYEERPYPVAGPSGEGLGIFQTPYEMTIGQVLKPTAIMHADEMMGAGGEMPGQGTDPAADVMNRFNTLKEKGELQGQETSQQMTNSPYGKWAQTNIAYANTTQAMGLRGFFFSNLKKSITGEKALIPYQDTFASSADMDSIRRKYWDLELGGLGLLCFPGNTKVKVINGYKPISEITIGEMVYSFDGKYRRVVGKKRTEDYNENLLRIKVGTIGGTIEVTKNHRFPAIKRKRQPNGHQNPLRKVEIKDYRIDELCKNDYLCYPIISQEVDVQEIDLDTGTRIATEKWIYPKKDYSLSYIQAFEYIEEHPFATRKELRELGFSDAKVKEALRSFRNGTSPKRQKRYIKLTNELLFVLGWWLAEGSAGPDSGQISFCLNEKERYIAVRVGKILSDIFNVTPCFSGKAGSSCVVSIGNVVFATWLNKNLGRGAHNKFIPTWIKELPKERLKILVAALSNGDGWSGGFTSVSEQLVIDLFESLLRFGIRSNIKRNYLEKVKNSFYPQGDRRRDSLRNYLVVIPTHVSAYGKLRNGEPFALPSCPIGGRSFIYNGMLFIQIKKIEEISFNGTVYDLSIEDVHYYMVDLVAVHNSEPYRRFNPDRPYDEERINPIANAFEKTAYFLPGDNYFINFKQGDPFSKIAMGEYRLPGAGYAKRYSELEGLTGNEYPLIHKYKILADVAPYSKEFRDIRAQLERFQPTPYELAMFQETEAQLEEKRKYKNFIEEDQYKGILGAYASGIKGLLRNNPIEQNPFFAPAHKLLPYGTPEEEYERSIYGKSFREWSDPYGSMIRPTLSMAARPFGADIPDERREAREIEEYFDKLEYIKHKRLAMYAEEIGNKQMQSYMEYMAGRTLTGADPYLKPTPWGAMPQEERGYLEAILNSNTADRERVMELAPENTRDFLVAEWDKRALAAIEEGRIEASEGERNAIISAIEERSNQMRGRREREAEEVLRTTNVPPPEWLGWCIPASQIVIGLDGFKTAESVKVGEVMSLSDKKQIVNQVFKRKVEEEILSIRVFVDHLHEMKCTKNHEILILRHDKCKYAMVGGQGGQSSCVPRTNKFCDKHNCKTYDGKIPFFISAEDINPESDFLAIKLPDFQNKKIIIDLAEFCKEMPGLRFDESHVWNYYTSKDAKKARPFNRYLIIDEGMCWLFGYYAAEGHISYRNNSPKALCFTQSTKEIFYYEKLNNICSKLGLKATRRERRRKEGWQSAEISIGHPIFAYFVGKNIPGVCDTKKIIKPEWIFNNRKNLEGFVVGIFNGDAIKTKDNTSLVTTSYELAIFTKECLWGLGIGASIRGKNREAENRRRVFFVKFGRNKNTEDLIEKAIDGYNSKLKHKWSRNLLSPHYYSNNKYLFLRIKSIDQEMYSGDVYDFSVQGEHEYRSLIGTYHNSPRQNLDDIKFKYLLDEGRDYHYHNLWDNRLRSLRKIPGLSQASAIVKQAMEYQPYQMSKEELEEVAYQAGVQNPIIVTQPGSGIQVNLNYERDEDIRAKLRDLGEIH